MGFLASCRTDDGQEVSDIELVAALAGCDKELAEHELKEAGKVRFKLLQNGVWCTMAECDMPSQLRCR